MAARLTSTASRICRAAASAIMDKPMICVAPMCSTRSWGSISGWYATSRSKLLRVGLRHFPPEDLDSWAYHFGKTKSSEQEDIGREEAPRYEQGALYKKKLDPAGRADVSGAVSANVREVLVAAGLWHSQVAAGAAARSRRDFRQRSDDLFRGARGMPERWSRASCKISPTPPPLPPGHHPRQLPRGQKGPRNTTAMDWRTALTSPSAACVTIAAAAALN